MAYTIWARSETTSVINAKEFFYLCCMLRRNDNEMRFMPHLGYNLANQLYTVATNRQRGGKIRIGGIITKIANALRIPTGNDVVEGDIVIDLPGLVRAQLIAWNDIEEAWINLGPGTIKHRLPLTTDIDPHDHDTWGIVDEPFEPQAPPPPPPPHPQPAAAQPQAGPSNEQLMAYMVAMQQNLTDAIGGLRLHMDDHFRQVDGRLDDLETAMSEASFYAQSGVKLQNPNFDERPPTPPHTRRKGLAAAMAYQAAQAEARARVEAEAQAQAQGGDEEEDDDEESAEFEQEDMDTGDDQDNAP